METWWRCTGKDGAWFGLGHQATSAHPVPCCCDWLVRGTCIQRAAASSHGAAPFHHCRELRSSQNPCSNIAELASTKLECLTSLNTFSKKKENKTKTKAEQIRADRCGVTLTTDNVVSCFHVIVTLTSWWWDSQVNSKSKKKYRETYSWMALLCKLGKPLQNHCVSIVRYIWPNASFFSASFVSSPSLPCFSL